MLTDEEKTELTELLDNVLEVYKENLSDVETWNKTKKDGLMSKFNQSQCDAKIAYYKRKIELVKTLKPKIEKML